MGACLPEERSGAASGTLAPSDDLIAEIIGAAVAEANASAPPEMQIDPAPGTRLYGPGGVLDSLGLVSLIVAVESAVQERLGICIALADDRVLSEARSPFRTLASLQAFLAARLVERAHA